MYHARAQGVPRWEMCSTHGAVLLVRVTGKEAGLVVRALQEASYFGPAALISSVHSVSSLRSVSKLTKRKQIG